MSRIVFATCNLKPDFQPSDAVLAAALRARGHEVAAHPWNGDQAAFEAADLIFVRSTWDYMHAPQCFAFWLGSLEGRVVLNDPALMRWNLSKRYLMRLAAMGAPLAPTRFAAPRAGELARAMDELGLEEAVAKPVVSAGGIGLSVMRRDDPASLENAAGALGGSCMVQPLLSEIRDPGETSLVFLQGELSHAVNKRPTGGGILCQSEHGGQYAEFAPPPFAVREAQRILDLLPSEPFYARLDAIILDDALILMEVELIEPELFFDRIPAAAERFAAAVDRKLGL